MSTITLDTTPTFTRQAVGLIAAGLLLLAAGALLATWQPVTLPLGLVGLGVSGLALLSPCLFQQEEAGETLFCLTLASLITLAGIQLLA